MKAGNAHAGNSKIAVWAEGHVSLIVSVLIALKIILLFVFAWHSRFVMDEFAQLGFAKYLSNGLFDTVQPTKAVGSTVFFKLAHLIGRDAPAMLLVGRLQMALVGCATIAMIYACARKLGNDRLRAMTIVLLLLCFSNFIEQIFRTRAEPLAVFFAVAALLVIIRVQTSRPRDLLVAGVLSGLAFLSTQKSVYFNISLGLALIADAAIARRYVDGLLRGAWLVVGWTLPIIAYCLIFGGADPLPIARNLVFGPMEVATRGGAEYGGLRVYVLQTLLRNAILYALCFAGMIKGLAAIAKLDERRRISLIFAVAIVLFVFTHDQPWPYVFVMALPFMVLWPLLPLDRSTAQLRYLRLAVIALVIVTVTSFVRNVQFFAIDNVAQLELIDRAQALVGPNDRYFDGIGMLPNRAEPTTLWLDQHFVLATLQEGEKSEAYQVLAKASPKVILLSYRIEAIRPVIAGILRNRYVRVGPNILMIGRHLSAGHPEDFEVPTGGQYGLYGDDGTSLPGHVEIDGKMLVSPFHLDAGATKIILRPGQTGAFLLPVGTYTGLLRSGADNESLFSGVYD